jgi:hypothetical protein
VGPLVIASLGGGAGLAASLAAHKRMVAPYRMPLTMLAVVLLAAAHIYYWKRLRGRATTGTTVVLWLSTLVTLSIVISFHIWPRLAGGM